MKTAYISGPMRGFPQFNFPLFDEVAKELRADGVVVFNPAEHDRNVYPDIETWPGFAEGDVLTCPKFNMPTSMKWDIDCVVNVDWIVMLPGWKNSIGARVERLVAEQTATEVWLAKKENGVWSFVADDTKRLTTVWI